MDQTSFNYDPQREGFDTDKWATLSGTPSTSGGAIVINAAGIVAYGDMTHADATLNLTIPAAPTAGDARSFGLAFVAKGAHAYFHIAGTVVTAVTTDGYGNTYSIPVTWVSTWTNAATEFRVKWQSGKALFYIGGQLVASITDVSVPGCPMALYVSNGNSDNLHLNYAQVSPAYLYH